MNKYKKALEIVKRIMELNDYLDMCLKVWNTINQEEYDFLKNIFFEQPNKGDRKYVAYFKKYYLYSDGRKYQDNAHFCISSLETDAIKRPFENDNIVVEELKVTERLTGKVIYQGTSYEEYLKVIEVLL